MRKYLHDAEKIHMRHFEQEVVERLRVFPEDIQSELKHILADSALSVMHARITCQSDDYGNRVLLRIPGIGDVDDSVVRILVADIPEIVQALSDAVAEIKKGNI